MNEKFSSLGVGEEEEKAGGSGEGKGRKNRKKTGGERIHPKFCSLVASGITRCKMSLGANWSRWNKGNRNHVYTIPILPMETHSFIQSRLKLFQNN